MKNTAIIIPTRLEAKRFPNKPLATINNVPMIIHVFNRAKESKVGEVFVATPDEEIFNYIRSIGGEAVMTSHKHKMCNDRVVEALHIIENEKLPSELGWVKPAVELVKEDVHDMSERIANASSPIVEPAAVANARRGIGFGHGLF